MKTNKAFAAAVVALTIVALCLPTSLSAWRVPASETQTNSVREVKHSGPSWTGVEGAAPLLDQDQEIATPTPPLPADAQSTSGPLPPPNINAGALEPSPSTATVIAGVPAYIWHHGCGPTAAGMVLGYWDGHGFDALVSGNASTQTSAVNEMMASEGAASNYTDYCQPIDDASVDPAPLPDLSEPPAGDEHPNDCVADYMKTSQSAYTNYYGWSWFSHVASAMSGYVNSLGHPEYAVTVQNLYMGSSLTWAAYCQEINAGRPMVFLVDTNGDARTDHFVTAVGYDVIGGVESYGCFHTYDSSVHWYPFAAMASGQGWGIYGGITFGIVSTEHPPHVGTVSPTGGSSAVGQVVNFTTGWTDEDGWEDLDWCFFLVAPNTSSAANIVFLHYNPEDNTLWLVKDDASGWWGPGTPGSAGALSNSRATLNCAQTTASRSGNMVQVTWALSFKAPYAGTTQNLYLYVKDHAGLAEGNVNKGTWTITGGNVGPHVGTVSPTGGSSAVGQMVSFTTNWTDANGWEDLDWCFFLVAPNTSSAANIVFLHYNPEDNTLWLVKDDASGWWGPGTPGVAGTLNNGKATLDCGLTTASRSGSTVQVTWALSFKAPYGGTTQNLYLYVKDQAGLTEGNVLKGTWTITAGNVGPHVGTVSPSGGSGPAGQVVSFTTTWTDTNGWQDLDECLFAVAPNLSSAANIVAVRYDPQGNTLWLANDAGTGFLGPKTPGIAGTLSNSQGTLDCGLTTVTRSGDTVQVRWPLTFKTAYKGAKKLYLYVSDLHGLEEGPTQKGTWTIY